MQRPAEFEAIAIRHVNGIAVRVGDVARVEEAAQDERSTVRLNGRDTVSLGVIRQATANPLELSASVRALLTKVQADLPPGIRVDIANDNSVFIDRSIRAVYTTIAEAVVLVALVIFVFLRTLRASIIPLVTIPVSLVGTFALMALFGFSHQHADPAGAGAGHRAGGGRCHRRAGKHLPPHRGGHDPVRGRHYVAPRKSALPSSP